MNLTDVQAVFERTEPRMRTTNKRVWITIAIVALIAVVAIIVINQRDSNYDSNNDNKL